MQELNEPSAAYSPETHKHGVLTEQIIRIFYEVYNTLGYGFLEKVYENALTLRLRKAGHKATQQQPITVYFDNEVVGSYTADIIVDDKVLIELKAATQLTPDHHAQLLNYLKATEYEVGLLLNFGPKPQVARKAYDNPRKRIGR